MSSAYFAAMSLLVAQTFGLPGYTLWAVTWSVLVYRHTSKPRHTGATLTTGESRSDA